MNRYKLLVLLGLVFLLAACGGEEAAPESDALQRPAPEVSGDLSSITAPRTPDPQAAVPPLDIPASGPIRAGCGDYRLLVTLKTNAVEAALRVSGPANAVDVVWPLSGPGLSTAVPPSGAATYTEDNREIFGVNANDAQEEIEARFVLLISGVQAGQQLQLEVGQDAPEAAETLITIANTVDGLESPGEELKRIHLTSAYQTYSLDLCAAEPMSPPQPVGGLPPRLLAFYYSWWSTTAEPEAPYRCGGDSFGWIRPDEDGRQFIVTAHMPIARDGDQTIYTQTACWQEVSDDAGRSGMIYDVWEANFLAEQMALGKAYGLDGFAVSVHGDNPLEMRFLQDMALPVAEQSGFLIAPLYEAPESEGWSEDEQSDIARVGEQLRAVVEIMAGQPAALTITGADGQEQVAIFVDPAVMWRFTTPESWADIRAIVDEAEVPYFLWSGPGAFAWTFTAGLDGLYNDLEVIETFEPPLGLSPYALRDERRLAYRAAAWTAREQGMPLALPVVLGWEKTAVVAEEDEVFLTRDYGAPGDYGKYYRVRWEDALEQFPDWIVITSWNEWVEGTELEPSDTYPPSRFDYLQATWDYACQWRGDCP